MIESRKERLLFYSLLFVIFILNLIFKLNNIGDRSFWYDEIISVKNTLLDFGHIKHEAEWDANPPFYYYVLWIWTKFSGISETGVRSMSAFFNALAACGIFIIVRRLSSIFHGVCATVLFSLHPFMFYYAQEARSYALLSFLIVLNLYLFRWFTQRPGPTSSIAVGLSNFLLLYTHYLTFPVLVCQFIYILWAHSLKNSIKNVIFLFGLPFALILLRFTGRQFEYLFKFKDSVADKFTNVPNLKSMMGVLRDLHASLWVPMVFFLVLLIVAVLGKRLKVKMLDIPKKFNLFILLTPIISLVILFAIGQFTYVFYSRYLIFTIPYFTISYIIFFRNRIFVMVLAVGISLFFVRHLEVRNPPQMDYRLAAGVVQRFRSEVDLPVILQTKDIVPLFTYYYDRSLFGLKGAELDVALEDQKVFSLNSLTHENPLHKFSDPSALLLQTFVSSSEKKLVVDYFTAQNYIHVTSESIPGVTLSYFKKVQKNGYRED